jgi:hypothetical protein
MRLLNILVLKGDDMAAFTMLERAEKGGIDVLVRVTFGTHQN